MKTRWPVQALTIVAAFCLMAGYVVYSQRQRPGILPKNSRLMPMVSTNAYSVQKSPVKDSRSDSVPIPVAPDSKVLVPVAKVSPEILPFATNVAQPKVSPHRVFPGSKSAAPMVDASLFDSSAPGAQGP